MAAVSIFTVLTVAVILSTYGRGCKSCESDLEILKCFYPLGGGETSSSLVQPKLTSTVCQNALSQYTSKEGQYWQDIGEVIASIRESLLSGDSFLPSDSKMVVFDIDETLLSTLDVLTRVGFGRFDEEQWSEWVLAGKAPAVPGMPLLLRDIRKAGFSIAFITGRGEDRRNATVRNLRSAGLGEKCSKSDAGNCSTVCYEKLIMRGPGDHRDATSYKSDARASLSQDFEIIASVGDQWSDLLGNPRPKSIFKMPNPFYYIP